MLALPVAYADDEKQAAFREVGAVLGWRLAPETLEERCRSADPEGNEVRTRSLKLWLEKNAPLIQAVDSRVAEVMPLLLQGKSSAEAVGAVRSQVKAMLLEAITPKVCKAERDPASTSWTSNGMPHVQESLAALYDWKVSHSSR